MKLEKSKGLYWKQEEGTYFKRYAQKAYLCEESS